MHIDHVLEVADVPFVKIPGIALVPRPANVATMLQVVTPPIADTARYDRLRNLQEADHEA